VTNDRLSTRLNTGLKDGSISHPQTVLNGAADRANPFHCIFNSGWWRWRVIRLGGSMTLTGGSMMLFAGKDDNNTNQQRLPLVYDMSDGVIDVKDGMVVCARQGCAKDEF